MPPASTETVRRLVLAALVLLVCGLALRDSYPWSGPVLLTLTATHGVHATDPLVLALAALSVGLLVRAGGRPLTPAGRPATP